MNADERRKAVVAALGEFNQELRLAHLILFSGTCEFASNSTVEPAETNETGGPALGQPPRSDRAVVMLGQATKTGE